MNVEPQSVSPSSFLGVPLLQPRKEESTRDRRVDKRVVCNGKLRLVQPNGAAPFQADLIDISANGFRVSFNHPAPAAGAEVEFRHRFFHGRAQLMWVLRKENHYEAGCRVLRD